MSLRGISHQASVERCDHGNASVVPQSDQSAQAHMQAGGAAIAGLALLRRRQFRQEQDTVVAHVPLTGVIRSRGGGGDDAGPLSRAIRHKAVENLIEEKGALSREEVTSEEIKIREKSGLNNPEANFSALPPDVKAVSTASVTAAGASGSSRDHLRSALQRLRQAPASVRPVLERVRSAATESAQRLAPSSLFAQTGQTFFASA